MLWFKDQRKNVSEHCMASHAQSSSMLAPQSTPPYKNNLHRGRKRWILSVPTKGEVWVDDGAARALKKHASLFAAGVTEVKGTFHQQDAVKILDSQGKAIAHGLVNYTSEEMEASKVGAR